MSRAAFENYVHTFLTYVHSPGNRIPNQNSFKYEKWTKLLLELWIYRLNCTMLSAYNALNFTVSPEILMLILLATRCYGYPHHVIWPRGVNSSDHLHECRFWPDLPKGYTNAATSYGFFLYKLHMLYSLFISGNFNCLVQSASGQR